MIFQLVPLKGSASVESTTGGAGTWSLKPTAQMSLAAIAAVAKSSPSICGLETTWRFAPWRSALALATTPAVNNITNTSVRIALNLVPTDRGEMIVSAIMLILEIMNNMALALLVGFISRESQRHAL